MLVNPDFAFIHFPKTAGKSLTKYFIEAWEDPIFGLVSPGQLREVSSVIRSGVTLRIGKGHENMYSTSLILREKGIKVENLRAIFVCIRNPYDIAVSTYFFMRETFFANRNNSRFRMAMEMSFEDFWCNDSSMVGPERWLTLNGTVLENQRFIRFESIRKELEVFENEFSFRKATLPHLNPTWRGEYLEYMSARAEEAIYRRFRYLFEAGYYRRESFNV